MYSSVIRGYIRTDAFSLNTLVRYYILVFQHRYVVHCARVHACVYSHVQCMHLQVDMLKPKMNTLQRMH